MSASSNNRLPSATQGGAAETKTPASADNAWDGLTGRRRSSDASAGKFAGLMNQKRNSQDASAAARKASFDDMKPKPGFLGQMWNNVMKGPVTESGPGAK